MLFILRCYKRGSPNVPKQIMENLHQDRLCQWNHNCDIRLTYNAKDRANKCDSLVYQYTRGTYRFFRIVDISEEYLVCKRLKVRKYKAPGLTLPWDQVGVVRLDGEEERKVRLNAKFVHGKAFKVKDVIVSAARNMLADN